MIITGSDANKYSRNAIAAEWFFSIMGDIVNNAKGGGVHHRVDVTRLSEVQIAQLAEWLREKNYDLFRQDNVLAIDWSSK